MCSNQTEANLPTCSWVGEPVGWGGVGCVGGMCGWVGGGGFMCVWLGVGVGCGGCGECGGHRVTQILKQINILCLLILADTGTECNDTHFTFIN